LQRWEVQYFAPERAFDVLPDDPVSVLAKFAELPFYEVG
jgi:hypothetical protein